MKKRLVALILAATMALSLTACGAKDNSSADKAVEASAVSLSETSAEVSTETSASTETSEDNIPDGEFEQPWYEEYVFLYYTVIQDFYNAIYHKTQLFHDSLYAAQMDIMYMSDEEKAKVGMCFEDIDGDGDYEMLLGMDDTVFAVCGMTGTGPKVLIGAGYRSMLSIYENGLMVYEGSSGASSYSYEYIMLEYSQPVTQDFYYYDYDVNVDKVRYFHSNNLNWDLADEDEVSEDEFNLMTDIGLEKRNYSGVWIPIKDYEEGLDYIAGSASIDELTEDDVTWSLFCSETKDNYTFAEDDGVIQTLNFFDDRTASYYYNDSTNEYKAEGLEMDHYDDSNQEYFYISFEDGPSYSFNVIGFTKDGMLLVQKMYYNHDAGEVIVINEYYQKSMG